MTSDRERFESLLPFYINGTLGPQDLAFVERFLAVDASAQSALLFAKHLQQTVLELANEQPDAQRVERFLGKFNQSLALQKTTASRETLQQDVARGFKQWWLGLASVAIAASAAMLVLMPGVTPTGVLHVDGLDGQPDLELVLAQNIEPTHELVVAYLEQFNGQIVGHSQEDGHHRISVDLQNRAANQHGLIAALQDAGHLKSYTLLASR